ncbi:MAG: 30S ribosomal protein S16 [Nitrospinae bacterium RIFCSPLOWO2_12_FULL_45_22]|nr:MAG: 30S ribosomal protein S16 [Nitrospinae bacterium RIFCSPLOWO2_12_FULL_45_22]
MVKIRLKRMGTKKRSFYRIVAMDSRAPRDSKCLDELGIYDPMQQPTLIKVDQEKIKKWLAQGAQLTDTARSLVSKIA